MTSWTRPESVAFPTIWSTFEGKKVINGLKRKYWIQDLTEEYKEEALSYMTKGYAREDVLFKYGGMADDLQSLEEMVSVWKKWIDMKLALICLTKDDNGTNRFVGCNILMVSQMSQVAPRKRIKGKALSMVTNIIHDIHALKNLYAELNVDKYLMGVGLYVSIDYRGDGVGVEILKARKPLSLAVGLSTSITIFTSIGGQRSAEKAGFKDIIVYPCKDLTKLNPSYILPGIENDPVKTLRVMYAKYDE